MQYHQLVEPLLEASHASVMLYGPFTARRRLLGAFGALVSGGGGGGGGGGFLAAGAPELKTSASVRMLAARAVLRTDIGSSRKRWQIASVDTRVARCRICRGG
jgi:hypothetical protein